LEIDVWTLDSRSRYGKVRPAGEELPRERKFSEKRIKEGGARSARQRWYKIWNRKRSARRKLKEGRLG